MGVTTPEGRIKQRLRAMLLRHKVWFFLPGNNGFGKSGIPDFIAIVRGMFVGIEVKADRTKVPTALQYKCAKEIRAAGGVWFLVYDDETIRGVEEFICAGHREGEGAGAEAEQT